MEDALDLPREQFERATLLIDEVMPIVRLADEPTREPVAQALLGDVVGDTGAAHQGPGAPPEVVDHPALHARYVIEALLRVVPPAVEVNGRRSAHREDELAPGEDRDGCDDLEGIL